jgi:hypothetical protein
MPNVRLVSDYHEPDEEVSISLERTPIILADLRRSLPKLKRELQEKWTVHYVDIESRPARVRNPYTPGDVITPACIVLTIAFAHSFGSASGKEIGKEVGKTVAREISKYVRKWLKSSDKRRLKRRKRRN